MSNAQRVGPGNRGDLIHSDDKSFVVEFVLETVKPAEFILAENDGLRFTKPVNNVLVIGNIYENPDLLDSANDEE